MPVRWELWRDLIVQKQWYNQAPLVPVGDPGPAGCEVSLWATPLDKHLHIWILDDEVLCKFVTVMNQKKCHSELFNVGPSWWSHFTEMVMDLANRLDIYLCGA